MAENTFSLPDIRHLTIKKTTFNSLPREIIKTVLCNVDSQYLPGLKRVCSYWYNMITELLDFKKVELSNERIADALNIFNKLDCTSDYSFSMYRAPCVIANVVSPAVLYLTAGLQIKYSELMESDFVLCFDKLVYLADLVAESSEELDSSAWRCILGITGLDYPTKEFEYPSIGSDFAKEKLTKYKWYEYWSNDLQQSTVIVLYPDNRTIAILIHPSEEVFEHEQNNVDNYYGGYDGYDEYDHYSRH
jgi:hypothetical protein